MKNNCSNLGEAGAAFGPLIDEAVAKGIIVTSIDTNLPAIEEKYKDRGFGYVGEELYPWCSHTFKDINRFSKFA